MNKSNGALETRAAQAVTMELSDYQVQSIISDAEARINEIEPILAKKKEPMEKAFETYMALNVEYETIKKKLQENRALIDKMKNYKSSSPLRLLKSLKPKTTKVQDNEESSKRGPIQFTWMKYAVEILKEKNTMMDEEQLWEAICQKFNIMKRMEEMGVIGRQSNIKWGAQNSCWNANVEKTMAGTGRESSRYLFKHDGLLGLVEWATADFKPKPEYRKQLKAAV